MLRLGEIILKLLLSPLETSLAVLLFICEFLLIVITSAPLIINCSSGILVFNKLKLQTGHL